MEPRHDPLDERMYVQPSSARSPDNTSVANGIPKGSSDPIITLICGRVGSVFAVPKLQQPPVGHVVIPGTVVASQRITSWDKAWTSLLQAFKSCSIACQYVGLLSG